MSVRVVLAGIQLHEVTNRVLSISKIHDQLEAENGQFAFPNLEVELDNQDGWLGGYYKNLVMSDDIRCLVEVSDGVNFGRIFDGRLKDPAMEDDIGNKIARFEAEASIASMADVKFQLSSGQDDYKFKLNIFPFDWPTGQNLGLWNVNVPFNMGQALTYGYNDVFAQAPYYYDGVSHLAMLGDILRSFASVVYWREGFYYIRDRYNMMYDQPTIIQPRELLGAEPLIAWKRQRKGVKISSIYAFGGNQLEKASAAATDTEQTSSFQTNILANVSIRLADGAFFSAYSGLAPVVLGRYENWYVRSAAEWPITLSGLLHWVGETIYIPIMQKKWMIEETWKDLEKEVTECLLVELPVEAPTMAGQNIVWDWSESGIEFGKLAGYPYKMWPEE